MSTETRQARFRRIAPKRVKRVLRELELLGNTSNINHYRFSQEEVDKIFNAIEQQLKETRFRFLIKRSRGFEL